jgi:hypothetical protein
MRIIVQIGILLASLMMSMFADAQSKADKIFDTYSGKQGVTALGFSRSSLKPFEFFLDDEARKVVYKMEKIQFLNYNQDKGEQDAQILFNRIQKELSGTGYFLIDPKEIDLEKGSVDWDSEEVLLIGHGKRKQMDEFHIVILEVRNCVLLSFFGDIQVEDIKGCSKFRNQASMNISF